MMKRFFIALTLVLLCKFGIAQKFPANPNKLVSDFTNTLSQDQVAQLTQKLEAFNDSTSNEIAVVVIQSVGEYDINDYALQLGRKWGVGGKNKNNGIILLIAIGDRKLSIQTGYGLEGALPDMYTKRIIEYDIKPYFKSGDYYAGIATGTDAIIKLVKGEYKNDNPNAKRKGNKGGSAFIVIIIVIIIIFILRRGGGGGGGQVIGSRGVGDALFWGMLLGSGRGSGGGGWGGGSSSGGGGGFGGFGGGSFGGGGSSGTW